MLGQQLLGRFGVDSRKVYARLLACACQLIPSDRARLPSVVYYVLGAIPKDGLDPLSEGPDRVCCQQKAVIHANFSLLMYETGYCAPSGRDCATPILHCARFLGQSSVRGKSRIRGGYRSAGCGWTDKSCICLRYVSSSPWPINAVLYPRGETELRVHLLCICRFS